MKNYVNEKMKRLGAHRSVIRELFEYANKRRAEIGDENVFDFSIGNPSAPTPAAITDEMLTLLKNTRTGRPSFTISSISSITALYFSRFVL